LVIFSSYEALNSLDIFICEKLYPPLLPWQMQPLATASTVSSRGRVYATKALCQDFFQQKQVQNKAESI